MKLWIDEDLSPSLVEVGHRHGLDATCNRDRGMLGRSDVEVLARCIKEDRTLVTNNYGDFRRLCEAHSIHPGLIVLPTLARETQQQLSTSPSATSRSGAHCI
jgi:predicted nuclease of predicted toxin-antitoxin system